MLLPTHKIRMVLLLQLLLLVGTAIPAFALNFNAYWLYRQVGGENADTRREFQQRYSLGVGPTLTYQPTSAITASGNVSYSRTERGKNGELVGVDQLTPAGRIRLLNDIFLAQLSGSNTRRYSDVGASRSATSWDATVGSTWNIPFFPSVGFNYGERTDDVNPSLKTTFKSASVSWDLLLAQLRYAYQESKDEDKVNQKFSRIRSHFARLESNGRFWNKRIGFNFAQQFLTSNSNSSTLQGQAMSLVADPPVDPSQEDVVLDGNSQLSDGDLEAAAVEVPAFQRLHLGLTFDFNRQVGVLYIYLDPLTAADPGFQWDIYTRDLADTVWERQASGVTAIYNASEHRLELTLSPPLFQKKIMVAADNESGAPVTITEIEAGTALQENIRSSNTDYLTNLGVNVKLTRTVDASANLSLERLNTESDQASIAYDHRTISSRLRWAPVPYLIPSIGYSETEDQQTGGDEQVSRSYSLIVTTIPLPTMTVTLGGTRTERFINQVKTENTDQYSLYTKAQIYPDLTANLSASQRYQEALDSDGQTRDTTTFSTRLNLNARLTQAVVADFTSDYSRQRQVDGTSENATAKLQMLYRPSELLALHGSYDKDLLRSETPATLLLGLNLTMLRTNKTRVNLVTNYRYADKSSSNFVLTGSWDINRNWALQTKANYTLAEQYHYDFFVSMSLRL